MPIIIIHSIYEYLYLTSNNPAGNVYNDLQYKQLPASGRVHQGDRRVVEHVRILRVPGTTGVCSG